MDTFLKTAITDYVLRTDARNVSKYSNSIKESLLGMASFYDVELETNDRRYNNTKLLKELQDIIKNKKQTGRNTSLKNKIKLIAKIYNLDEAEFGYFLYYICKSQCSEFDEFVTECSNNSVRYFVGQQLLKLSALRSREALESLYLKGVIEEEHKYRRPSKYTLHDNISEILEDVTINTEKRIKNFLLGNVQSSELKWKDYDHISKERDRVASILKSATEQNTKGINILLYGDVGTGKTEFAKMITESLKLHLYSISCEDAERREASRKERLSDLKSKQAILSAIQNSCILFDEAEDVMTRGFFRDKITSKAYLNSIIENTPVPILWTTNDIHDVDPAVLRRMTYTIPFEKLSEELRLDIWKNILKKNKFKVKYQKLIELNRMYDISPSIITNAVKTTKMIGGTSDDFSDFIESVTQVVTKKKNVQNRAEFDMEKYNDTLVNTDIDIPNLTDKIQSCGKLNFSLCLYGEPGTGKSLYAKYLAKQLGLECIHKRVSDLMSKWVGETEQNIAKAFAEARSKKAMLIFDEADSFLQTRNNAGRSWEISQVNEMLTQMEAHEYPFVCTTNLLGTLDEASLRRFTFKIKFDFMTVEQANLAFEDFFGIKNPKINIKGLTAGDFATVKKKADFLNITDKDELIKMLADEVKIKKSETLKCTIGF